jgi:hypothetical protein
MDKSAGLIVRTVKPHLESVRANKHLAAFTLANVGPTDIEITEIGTALIAEAKSESIKSGSLQFVRNSQIFPLAKGQEIVCLSPSIFPPLNLYWLNDKKSWFCVGYIKYRCISDKSHGTIRFCRKWDFQDWGWHSEFHKDFKY